MTWVHLPIPWIDSWNYEELGGTQMRLERETLPIGLNRARDRHDRYVVGVHLDLSAAEGRPITALRIYFARNSVAPSIICSIGVTPMNTPPGVPVPLEATTGDSFPLEEEGGMGAAFGPGEQAWGFMPAVWVREFEQRRPEITGLVLSNAFTPIEIYRPEHAPGLRVEARIGPRTLPHPWSDAIARGVPMRAAQVSELRVATDGCRRAVGLPAMAWGADVLPGDPLRADALNQLRSALSACAELRRAEDPTQDCPPIPPPFAAGAPALAEQFIALRRLADAV